MEGTTHTTHTSAFTYTSPRLSNSTLFYYQHKKDLVLNISASFETYQPAPTEMTTPESIFEADPGLSDFINHARLIQRNPSYNRRRPHTYALVPSRNFTRAKYRRKKTQNQPSSEPSSTHSVLHRPVSPDDNEQPSITELESSAPGSSCQHQYPTGSVSDLLDDHPGCTVSPLDGTAGDVSPLTPKALTPQRPQHGDGICNTSNTQQLPSVDDVLVEAIARNVAQQLQVLSIRSPPSSRRQDHRDSDKQPPEAPGDLSRTSSERKALDRFTRELQRYAQHTGAKGKLPTFTPKSTTSNATVRTISALLPFRPEFKAAGLAVTSNDQAKHHSHRTKANAIR